MVKIADQDLAFFIYYEDELAGVCVILPDINPLLKRLNGRIGLPGLLKFLLYRREITGLRGLLFGVKEKYRQLGLPLLAFRHLYEAGEEERNISLSGAGMDPGGQRVDQLPGGGSRRQNTQKIQPAEKVVLIITGESTVVETEVCTCLAEHRVPIIAFVWRPEEMSLPVTQMAQRTGTRAIFDCIHAGDGGAPFRLTKSRRRLPGQGYQDFRPCLAGSVSGAVAQGDRGPKHLGRMPSPVFPGRIPLSFSRD